MPVSKGKTPRHRAIGHSHKAGGREASADRIAGAFMTIFRETGMLDMLAAEMDRRRVQAGDAGGDDWIDQRTSPLGRRRHNELCRSGELGGARKVGRSWKVRRSVLNAWIEAHEAPATPLHIDRSSPPIAEYDPAVEAALERANLVRVRRAA
ncbi:MAG: hypothetical protein R3B70_03365 [Polyangiaceae bacterium]